MDPLTHADVILKQEEEEEISNISVRIEKFNS